MRCVIDCHLDQLMVRCASPIVPDYEVIVQSSDSNEVYKLYVNRSVDLLTPVIIRVEQNGVYQVFVLAIVEGRGILDSNVKFIGQVDVNGISKTTGMFKLLL